MSIKIGCYSFCSLLSVVKTPVIYVAILIFLHSCSTSSPAFATLVGLAELAGLAGLVGLPIIARLVGLAGLARLVGLRGLAGLATLAYSGGGSDADTLE